MCPRAPPSKCKALWNLLNRLFAVNTQNSPADGVTSSVLWAQKRECSAAYFDNSLRICSPLIPFDARSQYFRQRLQHMCGRAVARVIYCKWRMLGSGITIERLIPEASLVGTLGRARVDVEHVT